MNHRKQMSMTPNMRTSRTAPTAPTGITIAPANGMDGATAKGRTVAALRPNITAAMVMNEYIPLKDLDIAALAQSLADGIDRVQHGDLKDAEAMLYGQAQTLQAIFANLARSATEQAQLKHWEARLKMALKAQNQCRMTLETLATIKNPPVVIARQANISQGHQQVNNGPLGPEA